MICNKDRQVMTLFSNLRLFCSLFFFFRTIISHQALAFGLGKSDILGWSHSIRTEWMDREELNVINFQLRSSPQPASKHNLLYLRVVVVSKSRWTLEAAECSSRFLGYFLPSLCTHFSRNSIFNTALPSTRKSHN